MPKSVFGVKNDKLDFKYGLEIISGELVCYRQLTVENMEANEIQQRFKFNNKKKPNIIMDKRLEPDKRYTNDQ